jgi:hypothetical protein
VNQGYWLHGQRVGQPQNAGFLASGRRGQRYAQRDDGDTEPAQRQRGQVSRIP